MNFLLVHQQNFSRLQLDFGVKRRINKLGILVAKTERQKISNKQDISILTNFSWAKSSNFIIVESQFLKGEHLG